MDDHVFGVTDRTQNPTSFSSSSSRYDSMFDSYFDQYKPTRSLSPSPPSSPPPLFDKPLFDDHHEEEEEEDDPIGSSFASVSLGGSGRGVTSSGPPPFDEDEFLENLGRTTSATEKKGDGFEEFDDLLGGFGGGGSSPPEITRESFGASQQKDTTPSAPPTVSMQEDPFAVLEKASNSAYSSSGLFTDTLENMGKHTGSESRRVDGFFTDPLENFGKPESRRVDRLFMDPLDDFGKPARSGSRKVDGLFADPVGNIGRPLEPESKKADIPSDASGMFEDTDVFAGFNRSMPSFSTEPQISEQRNNSLLRNLDQMSSTNQLPRKESVNRPSVDAFDDLLPEIYGRETPATASSSFQNSESFSRNVTENQAQKSSENFEASDLVWLTVSDILLVTQPTNAPPPAHPPPPLVTKQSISGSTANWKDDAHFPEPSQSYSYSNGSGEKSGASPMDELEDFAMAKPTNYANGYSATFANEEIKKGSDPYDVQNKEEKERLEREEKQKEMEEEQRGRERERELELERERQRARQMEEEEQKRKLKELEIQRERKQAVENAIREARERAANDARLRAERAAVQKASAEARERAAAEARERAAKVAAEARERAAAEARERAAKFAAEARERETRERAAAEAREKTAKAAAEARERAAAEARERAAAQAKERAAAEAREKAAAEARERAGAEDRGKSAAEALAKAERAAVGRAAAEARRRAERAAVERAAAEARERAAAVARARAAAATSEKQQSAEPDLDSIFGTNSRASSEPKQRNVPMGASSNAQAQDKPGSTGASRTYSGSASTFTNSSSTNNLMDDLSSIFGAPSSSAVFQEIEGESEERRKARIERHQRTLERAAKALADKNERDLQNQREQEEKHRIGESLDFEIKRWAAGKEGNLRALLSTLHYILWPECGWKPVSLTDLITTAAVKKEYRKATLCIHPDKVQQKGANLQQKYIAEKVFDLLKEAWNKLNSEELF